MADEYYGDVTIDFEHDDFAWVKPEDLTNYDRVSTLDGLVKRAKEAFINGKRLEDNGRVEKVQP